MPTVDFSDSGSHWSCPIMPQAVPLPSTPSNSPPYLPTFLERPRDAPLPLPLQLSDMRPSPDGSATDATATPSAGAPADTPRIDSPANSPANPVAPSPARLLLPISLPLRVRRLAGDDRDAPSGTGHDFGTLAGAWNSLAGTLPFRSFAWMESWWRHYRQPGWQTYLLKIEDAAGQIVGIAPWYLSESPIAGRVVQFLGSGEACSEYQSLLARPGHEATVAAAIAQWMSGEAARDWDLLLLTPAAADDPAVGALAADFRRRRHLVHQCPGVPCWRCELPPTWDEFVRGLSKSRRERLRQLTRKYFDANKVRTRGIESAGELDRAFAMFVDMHQRRRQSLGQPGCYSSPSFLEFHREVSRRLYADGKLRLLWTELDGRPVGAEYAFCDSQTVYYYSTGVEPDAMADHPGWLAMIGSLRRAIEDGCRQFDFLRGDEAYKCSWGARRVATVETRIVARRGLAVLRHEAWLVRQQFRRWAKGVMEWNARRKQAKELSSWVGHIGRGLGVPCPLP